MLITRSARDGDPLRRRLESLGAEVSHLPTIAVEPPESWTPLDQALRSIARYDYVVFTSRNAVEAVYARLPIAGFPEGIPAGPEVVAAGEATATLLHDRGVETLRRPERQNVQGVAAAILCDDIRGRSILYPTSDLAGFGLKQQLEAAGARVDQLVAYRTVAPEETDPGVIAGLRKGHFDVLTVASPSAVRNLKSILEPDWECLRLARLVCIGSTTARTARDEGLESVAIAADPSVEGLTQAILSLYDPEVILDG